MNPISREMVNPDEMGMFDPTLSTEEVDDVNSSHFAFAAAAASRFHVSAQKMNREKNTVSALLFRQLIDGIYIQVI